MNRVNVQPALLRWARERSGRSVHELQRRFPKFDAWERGEVLPTLKQFGGLLQYHTYAYRLPFRSQFFPSSPICIIYYY